MQVSPRVVIPTLPSVPALAVGESGRGALVAGLMFVEGVGAGWGGPELSEWFTEHAAAIGCVLPPKTVSDAVLGVIELQSIEHSTSMREALTKLLDTSRRRVTFTLRGLLARPSDDRFLQAAIFSGRVQRERRGKVSVWASCAHETDYLSDIVLSLFAVDVLTYREFYEENLCVCDVCGRLSFNPTSTTRAGCNDHIPATDSASGVRGSTKA
jgi:hypothetical protein